MKLLAKRPERRPQNATEFCNALEALAKSGKLGDRSTPAPEDPAAAQMMDLARALSTTPVSSELVALDGAALPSLPAKRTRHRRWLRPWFRAPRRRGFRFALPAAWPSGGRRGLAATFKEVPAIDSSDDRRKSGEAIAGRRGLACRPRVAYRGACL